MCKGDRGRVWMWLFKTLVSVQAAKALKGGAEAGCLCRCWSPPVRDAKHAIISNTGESGPAGLGHKKEQKTMDNFFFSNGAGKQDCEKGEKSWNPSGLCSLQL